MATTQIISDIRDAIPKRGIWYQYYGDIFVSVIPTERIVPYVRRKKTIQDDKKIDRQTCPWHLDWQYKEIEANYGFSKLGNKTYEIQITIDNEIHRIDSLVKNVAIEFQHTLSVSYEEMNLRYSAHKKAGYIPYLVIDLTGFSYKNFIDSISKQELKDKSLKLKQILNKWLKTNYNQNDNLFLDLEDAIVRLSDYFTSKHLRYHKSDFVDGLLNLETKYQEERSKQQKENEEHEKQLVLSEQKLRLRRIEHEREESFILKSESEDYKYYRVCMADEVIEPYLEKYKSDRFDYYSDSDTYNNLHEKSHHYYSKDSLFEIQYTTVSKIEIRQKNKYNYLYAEIKITEGKRHNKKVFKFKKENNKTILLPEDDCTF